MIIVNLFWLFPLAAISYLKPGFGAWLTLLAYTPLIVVAFQLKAGINDDSFPVIASETKQSQHK